jgi:hypothetical protein
MSVNTRIQDSTGRSTVRARRDWVKPSLSRLEAGHAELLSSTILDGVSTRS